MKRSPTTSLPNSKRGRGKTASPRKGSSGGNSVFPPQAKPPLAVLAGVLAAGPARSRRARRANERGVRGGPSKRFSGLTRSWRIARAWIVNSSCGSLRPGRASPSTGTQGYAVRRGCAKSSQRGKDRGRVLVAARSIRVPVGRPAPRAGGRMGRAATTAGPVPCAAARPGRRG